MEQTNLEKNETKIADVEVGAAAKEKETIATYAALLLCLIPGYWIGLYWYALYQQYSIEYSAIVVGLVILIIAYLAFIFTQAMVKHIILFIIK
ncbi:hypothetical protein [Sphingobacterium mizutaii]|uniref:hypothetical protein n=1 Tax=Sphingobacterium mizutaii TaxID=1010 RepID=UPI00162622B3|nr:hypothetical protein [Sphingobacterium mizutaii]